MRGGTVTKVVLAALVSAVLTGVGAWLTLARDVVTEAQAIDLIESRSPYLEDRKLLEKNLWEVAELRQDMTDLTLAVRELAVEMKHARKDEGQ
jgi:hypothetical protein